MRAHLLFLSAASLLVAGMARGDGVQFAPAASAAQMPALYAPDVIAAIGARTMLTATMSAGGSAISNREISFSIGATVLGTAHTDTDGVATLPWKPDEAFRPGTLTLSARYAGAGDLAGATATAPVHLLKAPTDLSRRAYADGGNQKTVVVVMGHTMNVQGRLARVTDGRAIPGASLNLLLGGNVVRTARTEPDGTFAFFNVKAAQIHDSFTVSFDGNDWYTPSASHPVLVDVVPPPRIAHACSTMAPPTAVANVPFAVVVTMCLGDPGTNLGPAGDGTFQLVTSAPAAPGTDARWGTSTRFHTDALGRATVMVASDGAGFADLGVQDDDMKYWVEFLTTATTELRRERVRVSASWPAQGKSGQPLTGHASVRGDDGKLLDFGAVFVLGDNAKAWPLTPAATTATLSEAFQLPPNTSSMKGGVYTSWRTDKHGFLAIPAGSELTLTR